MRWNEVREYLDEWSEPSDNDRLMVEEPGLKRPDSQTSPWSLLCAFRFSGLNLNPNEKRPAPETVSAGRHRVVYPPLPSARQNRPVKTHPSHQREAGVNDADQPCSGSELSRSIKRRSVLYKE